MPYNGNAPRNKTTARVLETNPDRQMREEKRAPMTQGGGNGRREGGGERETGGGEREERRREKRN